MKATASIDRKEITHNLEATLNGHGDINTLQDTEAQAQAGQETAHRGKPESELRAAARRHGLTLKELAVRMGVSYSYLCQVANWQRPWSPMLRERAMAVLGEVPGQGVVYRQGGQDQRRGEHLHPGAGPGAGHEPEGRWPTGRGLSYGYGYIQVSRGQRNMSRAPRNAA